jgi:hypothetical protein
VVICVLGAGAGCHAPVLYATRPTNAIMTM